MAAIASSAFLAKPSVTSKTLKPYRATPKIQQASRNAPRYRRCLTVRAEADEEGGGGLKGFANKLGKKVTGNNNYEFGDISKKAAKIAKDGAEELGKELTGDENYKFGDLSKKAAKGASKAAEHAAEVAAKDSKKLKEAADAAGKIITEDEDYAFGDITKKVAGNVLKKTAEGTKKASEYLDKVTKQQLPKKLE
eukprot:CAMPEP_0198228978 /NCGR_PEP_ID=MMETSP1445-20131203/113881_1 /TAXON_ID=36898 /ORGANISM="Pyramimonas sp., Strain CCMP2087" /LENGTH=193 /DNA_ID=CAMNT_0043909415 /DNA_START=1023 /DNA_END=1604 /DNA_ORIENTATION=+